MNVLDSCQVLKSFVLPVMLNVIANYISLNNKALIKPVFPDIITQLANITHDASYSIELHTNYMYL